MAVRKGLSILPELPLTAKLPFFGLQLKPLECAERQAQDLRRGWRRGADIRGFGGQRLRVPCRLPVLGRKTFGGRPVGRRAAGYKLLDFFLRPFAHLDMTGARRTRIG